MGGSEVDSATRAPASGKLTDGSRAHVGVIVWARHAAGPSYCAVVAIAASVHTACRGRWISTDLCSISACPDLADRCGGCVRQLEIVEQQRRVLAGLTELRQAHVVETRPLFEAMHVEGEWDGGAP